MILQKELSIYTPSCVYETRDMTLSTSRTTGLFYLGLVITGITAFLYAKAQLYVVGDAVATTLNLVTKSNLARIGISAELLAVAFQALLALWFFKLFQKVDSFAATALLVFGTINAVIIFASSAFWLNAFMLASAATMPLALDQATEILRQFEMHEALWEVGKLFFGLWLIPMGYLVGKVQMPRLLSWMLIAGGIGYVLSLLLGILVPGMSSTVLDLLTLPADIGEFWIVIYLLTKKVKVK